MSHCGLSGWSEVFYDLIQIQFLMCYLKSVLKTKLDGKPMSHALSIPGTMSIRV